MYINIEHFCNNESINSMIDFEVAEFHIEKIMKEESSFENFTIREELDFNINKEEEKDVDSNIEYSCKNEETSEFEVTEYYMKRLKQEDYEVSYEGVTIMEEYIDFNLKKEEEKDLYSNIEHFFRKETSNRADFDDSKYHMEIIKIKNEQEKSYYEDVTIKEKELIFLDYDVEKSMPSMSMSDILPSSKKSSQSKHFKCSFCDFATWENARLVKHIKKSHPGEKPFRCMSCDYTTLERKFFDNHVRTHTGEERFNCRYCFYATSIKRLLKKHMKTHDGEKKRSLKCIFCDYTTCAKSGRDNTRCMKSRFNNHLKTHTIFRCDDCDFNSSIKSVGESHARMHMGENTFF